MHSKMQKEPTQEQAKPKLQYHLPIPDQLLSVEDALNAVNRYLRSKKLVKDVGPSKNVK